MPNRHPSLNERIPVALARVSLLSYLLGGFDILVGLVAVVAGFFTTALVVLGGVLWILFGAVFIWAGRKIESEPVRVSRVIIVATVLQVAVIVAARVAGSSAQVYLWRWLWMELIYLVTMAIFALAIICVGRNDRPETAPALGQEASPGDSER